MPAGQPLPEPVTDGATTHALFSTVYPSLQKHWLCWQSALAGQAYPHPPQVAASLLRSAVQVPEACVPAVTGRVVTPATGVEDTGATVVSAGVTNGGAPDVVGNVQPAVSIMTMTTAHRNKR
jgi:hypothetical protein